MSFAWSKDICPCAGCCARREVEKVVARMLERAELVTYDAIAAKEGLSRGKVQEIERKALLKLRRALAEEGSAP
jgi:DNA-directed RNA polymerase sigma subunit (sigma70/sigma32)